MSEKQFPPAQALRAVPLKEVDELRKILNEFSQLAIAVYRPDLEAVVEFVEQFRPQALPEMTVAGGFNEVTITDETVNAEMLDLIRINGVVFTPEIIEVDGGEALSPLDAWLDLVNKDDRTSPEEYPDYALISSEELAFYMNSAARVKLLDEDDLEQIISDSLDMDWKPRDAARAIHAELYGKGEE